MNHIADANKMVSDTPRTDSLLTAILDLDGYVAHRNCPPQWVYYARELERELNAANESFRKLNIHALDLAARIKRLEEAGDAMANAYRQICYDAYDDRQVDNWFKAKEAKP